MKEKIKSIRLREDQLSTINELNLNFSKWVREKFDEEFNDHENVLRRITNCQKELKKLQKINDKIIQRNTKIKQMGKEKETFLRESKRLLEDRPEFLEGRIKLYKNTFGIVDRVSKEQFLELIDSV